MRPSIDYQLHHHYDIYVKSIIGPYDNLFGTSQSRLTCNILASKAQQVLSSRFCTASNQSRQGLLYTSSNQYIKMSSLIPYKWSSMSSALKTYPSVLMRTVCIYSLYFHTYPFARSYRITYSISYRGDLYLPYISNIFHKLSGIALFWIILY